MPGLPSTGFFVEEILAVIRRPKLAGVCLLLLLLGGMDVLRSAAVQSGSAPSFHTILWNTDDGLPDNHINCLIQTRDGYLWIGTRHGLARFDGVKFTLFDRGNTPEFSRKEEGGAVIALGQDAQGTLWIVTVQGVLQYRNDHFFRFSPPEFEKFGGMRISRLLASRGGGMWLNFGVHFILVESNQVVVARELKAAGRLLAWRELKSGALDFVSENGWATISADGREVRTNYARPASSYTWPCAVSGTNESWLVGTHSQGVWRLSNPLHPRWESAGFLSGQRVDWMGQTRSGENWVRVYGKGLGILGVEGWLPMTNLNWSVGYPSCVLEDAEGSRWLGTEDTLVQYRLSNVRHYSRAQGLSEINMQAVCQDSQGRLWMGGERGLSFLAEGASSFTTAPGSSSEFDNRCLCSDPNGGIWISKKFGGLWHWEDGDLVQHIRAEELPPRLNSILPEGAGLLWLACSEGLFRYQSIGGKLQRLFPSLGRVRCLAKAQKGGMWIGTAGEGLFHLAGEELSLVVPADTSCGRIIMAMEEDAQGTLWCLTEKGLCRVRDGQGFLFSSKQGLPPGELYSLVTDNQGNLWVGGARGVFCASLIELEAVAQGAPLAVQFLALGTADGMESPEVRGIDSRPTACRARDGSIWFATARGAVRINPGEIRGRLKLLAQPPVVVIEAVKSGGTVFYGSLPEEGDSSKAAAAAFGPSARGPVAIPAGRDTFYFQYTANSFLNPKTIEFRYRLVGYDSDWQKPTRLRAVQYANLPPGDYRFEVVAANAHGAWSNPPAMVSFQLAAGLWQRRWFQAFCGVGAFVLLFGAQNYRAGLLRQQHLDRERTRIARDLHDDLGAGLTGLALYLDLKVSPVSTADSQVSKKFKHAATLARDLASRMREVVWSINPECDSVLSLADFLQQKAECVLLPASLRIRFDFPLVIPELSLSAGPRHQLALCMREALNNVVRHAEAAEVRLGFDISGQNLSVRIEDDGRGFDVGTRPGCGIENMRQRMEKMKGSFHCVSKPGSGTVIVLQLPVKAFGITS